ncbi:DUF342 domain-containing protein [Alishewanella sp. HL-SH06]|uniref:DUF342 domain-containing protein n=1 Tax=Alishewanella sp. HL-SH06 TaxID=3461144 RepID=UPI00404276D9
MQFTEHKLKIIIKVPVSATAISAELIRKALIDAGYGRCFVLQAQIDALLAEYAPLCKQVEKQTLLENSEELVYPVAEKRPATVTFQLSEDKMLAIATVTAAYGGAPLAANALVKAAQEAGIVFGFQKEQIIQLIQTSSQAEPGVQLQAEIATGRLAKNGLNSRFDPLIPDMVVRRKRPQVDSIHKVDLRDFGSVPSVVAGDPLMRRLPPTLGEAGYTVTGEKMPAEPGKVIEWQFGSGVALSSNDPNLLLAKQDGLPRSIEHGATVDDVFNTSQVDLGSGHIIFKGSVVITGNVSAGMKVLAGGNVYIKGVVEGELIEAGGDVVIDGSIIGHQISEGDQHFTTVVKAKGDIHCALAQYSELNCQGSLFASKYLMHCKVEAKTVLAGSEDKINGKIVGGHYLLANGLSCGQLGSPSNSPVMIQLNRLITPLLEQQRLLREQLVLSRHELEECKAQIEQLRKASAGKGDPQLQMFELDFQQQRELVKALITEVKALEEQRQNILQTLEIKVTQQLFSAVEVQFGPQSVRTRREHSPSRIKISEGRPLIEPL